MSFSMSVGKATRVHVPMIHRRRIHPAKGLGYTGQIPLFHPGSHIGVTPVRIFHEDEGVGSTVDSRQFSVGDAGAPVIAGSFPAYSLSFGIDIKGPSRDKGRQPHARVTGTMKSIDVAG